jgi:hypothetical protein
MSGILSRRRIVCEQNELAPPIVPSGVIRYIGKDITMPEPILIMRIVEVIRCKKRIIGGRNQK